MASRPRRHSVVTLRLTVTPDDVFSDEYTRDVSISPSLPIRNHNTHQRSRYRSSASPLCRTPTSPLCRSPPSPMLPRTPTSPRARTPTSPRPQTPVSPKRRDCVSPVKGRAPSPLSPRSSNRVFRYDYCSASDQKNLMRRSSLLTVPSAHESFPDHHFRAPRKRSSSIAGPLRPPPDLLRYLNETSALERALGAASCSTSGTSSPEDTVAPGVGIRSQSPNHRSLPISPEHCASPSRRRNSNVSESTTSGVCRLRQFSITSRGDIVNRGDSLRPRRSASNTSVNSTISSASKEFAHSSGSNTPVPTPLGSKGQSPPGSKYPTPATTPVPSPKYYVGLVGAPGVGRNSLVTQFMTSEYMCAYDDSSDESGSERSVSVVLDGEEAELIFVKISEAKGNSFADSPYNIDAWVIIYSVSDKSSFREATSALGKIWTKGSVNEQAVILVANKTDLERTRVITTSEGRKLARTYECKFIEVSAGFAHHVDELLVGILVQIRLKQRSKSGEGELLCRGSIRRLSEKLKQKNSFKVKGIIGKMLCKTRVTKSCENLHML